LNHAVLNSINLYSMLGQLQPDDCCLSYNLMTVVYSILLCSNSINSTELTVCLHG